MAENNYNQNELPLDKVFELIRECGAIIADVDRSSIDITEKEGTANFVTSYDVMVQKKLFQGLKEIFPNAKFIGEEGSSETYSDRGELFIIDPIDGTTNFIKDYHWSCISVAYVVDGVVTLAVIYNPYLKEMFWAVRGKGAYLNGERIRVSEQTLEHGLVLFGTSPYYAEYAKKTFELAYDYYMKSMDVRRSGSAALDLCSIAAGRAELYFEMILSPWDFAAGMLLVVEAGGVITTMDGEPLTLDKRHSVLATNKKCRNSSIGLTDKLDFWQ